MTEDPEVLRRYQALDDQGKRLFHDIGQLVLDTKAHTLAEVRRVVDDVMAGPSAIHPLAAGCWTALLKRLESL